MKPFAVEVITLVPDVWTLWLGKDAGLVGRAFLSAGPATLTVSHLRDFGHGVHQSVDDAPFGGGPGMVLAVPPIHQAIQRARARTPGPVWLMTPRGVPFEQQHAQALARGEGCTLVCGRYEGVDERARSYVDAEVSVGDFVLSAGDPAAFCIVDAVVRLLPGVLGNASSVEHESFAAHGLEYPQYTRPRSYEGQDVPSVLLSGDHKAIAAWRQEQSVALTRSRRPDLLAARNAGTSPGESDTHR